MSGIRLRPFDTADFDEVVGVIFDAGPTYPFDWPEGRRLSRSEVSEKLEERPSGKTGESYVVEDDSGLVGLLLIDWWWDRMTPTATIWILPELRRQGRGTSVAGLAARRMFEDMPGHSTAAWVGDEDEAGIRFMERLGMADAGRMRRTAIRGGRYLDVRVFDLLRREWEEVPWR